MESSDSPTTQQRSRLDSTGGTVNNQSNQTTSQNVIWLCKTKQLLIKDNFII